LLLPVTCAAVAILSSSTWLQLPFPLRKYRQV
jgi:hypothetical protein